MPDHSMQVKHVSLVDAVVEQMIEAIRSGRFKAGEKIPSEKVLTKQFGVSRTTLREAFKKLEYLGAISIRQGNGTYLLDPEAALAAFPGSEGPAQAVVEQAAGEVSPIQMENSFVGEAIRAMFSIGNYQLTHYLEARECIENTAIALAVERMDNKDAFAVEEVLKKQEKCSNPVDYPALDYEFHSLLIMASKNEFLYQFWMALSPFIKEQIEKTYTLPGMIKNATANHHKIFAAVEKGDVKKAGSLNVDHLRILQGRMLSEAAKRVGEQTGQVNEDAR